MSSVTGVTTTYAVNDTVKTDKGTTASAGQSADFSEILAEAMTGDAIQSAATTAVSPMAAGYSSVQNGGLEQAILTASATGDMSDAQIAVFMLCAMMQGNQDGDYSVLMEMMTKMLSGLQGDTEELRNTVMQSDYNPYVLDTIDKNVFGTKSADMPGVSGTGSAILPTEAWKPATPAITNSEGQRSPEALQAVIDQFNVETAERYRPYRNGKDTYCNIFLWDVTAALGAEIPHYVDPETGEPRQYPDIKGAQELNAIAIDKWLTEHGPEYGWREVDAETAQQYANEGKPAVTTAGKNRHVQVVCPSKDGGFDSIRGVTIAQAGAKVTNYTHLSGIYSANGQKSVRYFVHE